MKKLRNWLYDEFWGFLVPLWIMVRHPRQVRDLIDRAEEMAWTWTAMWGKSPEEAAERAQQLFHLLFLQRFRHLCHPEWVADLEKDIPFNHLTWASE
jgi:hypothetical protein